MRDGRFSSVRLSWNVSPMNLDRIFEGSTGFNKPFLGFDLETFSPYGFPSYFRDPIVNFSVAIQGEAGFLIISFVSRPSFELELIKILRGVLEALGGGVLFTYNGLKFDVEYAVGRAALYGLDLRGVFEMYRHLDLYRLLRH
ncbi:TPA: hypothetical protein EYP70_01465, partial [Candidatus Bathyarchaeota archaeon]|nr:hypothetical protein [Candidatus Bathyarchaeota archaeon]